MAHQIAITVTEEVYRGLQAVAGSRSIGEFLEDLALPAANESRLEAAYREMALDDEREREASEWIEGLVKDSLVDDASR